MATGICVDGLLAVEGPRAGCVSLILGGVEPRSEAGKQFARKWLAMIERLTQGRSELLEAHKESYENRTQWPEEDRRLMEFADPFIDEAIAVLLRVHGFRGRGESVIKLTSLTKKFGPKTAVDDLSLVIRPGVVTGFLGPNGAGKSTTMRMILGLVKPTSGEVLVNGVHYEGLADPIRKVGALIDSGAVNPKYTARQHLELMATVGGIPLQRVTSLLQQTGLQQVQDQQIGEFSLGMRQRLGIAAALLGDPETVILDEPFNGLDVDEIEWLGHSSRTWQSKRRLSSSPVTS